LQALGAENTIVAPEAVQQWGDLNDWHHAIGTGPFIMQDFVSGSSATLVRNPNYWGYDERYPQNQLPYIDTLKFLMIPDDATALAALRTGKIDFMDNMSFQQAQLMKKTNPNIVQVSVPAAACRTIDPRNDVKPFNDVRVREAMQMTIDLPTIAQSYYGGTTSADPSTLTSNYLTGWGFPYSQWSQDLKAQYAYNPTAAKQLLAAAGYPNGFNTDVVADVAGDIDMLQIVKSYFAAVGINMTIQTMDSVSWFNFVRVNHKFDQMACRADGALGISTNPIGEVDYYFPGTPPNYYMVNDSVYNGFYAATKAATTVDAFKQALTAANQEIAQQHFVIPLLQPNNFAFCQPWLKGYNGQSNGISSTSQGACIINFYAARYWIDTKLKNSMGYSCGV
jgi:peptide/nickel transport system substrate-binding protein